MLFTTCIRSYPARVHNNVLPVVFCAFVPSQAQHCMATILMQCGVAPFLYLEVIVIHVKHIWPVLVAMCCWGAKTLLRVEGRERCCACLNVHPVQVILRHIARGQLTP